MGDEIKLRTPKFRVNFPKVFEPEAYGENTKKKYSLTMLFDLEDINTDPDQKKKYAALVKAAEEAVKAKWGGKIPKNLRNPFLDAGEYDYEGYEEGMKFIRASSMYQPGLVDQNLEDIIAQADFYSGCYAHADVTLYAYDVKGNRGVAFGLRDVQKIADGEPLGGHGNAKDSFSALADDDGSLAEDVESSMFG